MSLLDAAGVVTGDIWCTGAFSFESPLKDLLDSGEYTLEQLLAEDELLQELRGVHPQLIEFFSTEEAVTGLIQYVILPPGASPPQIQDKENPSTAKEKPVEEMNAEDKEDSEKEPGKWLEGQSEERTAEAQQSEQDEKDMVHIRFPYMACEVICCEINGIIDTIVDGFVPGAEPVESVVSSEEASGTAEVTLKDPRPQKILDLLFSMLYNSKPGEVDDYRAGYFDKILSVLFRKRPQAMSQYVNEGGGKGNVFLMTAMFKHLYSHSIMQIVQRLLLPQPPLPMKDEDDNEKRDDLYSDALEGAGDLDGIFRCNWSESDIALDLLLDCLIGPGSSPPELEGEEERQLSLCQNSSEVLITIIQNSPLTSPTLKSLTTDPVLEKLIAAATSLDKGASFSPHDSKLTCSMNVLESLILQLGGYGSVGTVMMPDDEDEAGAEQAEEGEDKPSSSLPREDFATSDTLIKHLPWMLKRLCELLLHPSAEEWVSPMQFSKTEPQKILGSSRLRIVRLLESLVLLGDPSVDSLLCQSDCLEICLDLFWKFQWCSMLHQSVANLLVHVFEGANARAELQAYFMVRCNLLGRLMDSFWEATEDASALGRAESGAGLSDAVMALKSNGGNSVPTSSVGSERGSVNSNEDVNKEESMTVSDDDVDAAMEQQDASGKKEITNGKSSEQVAETVAKDPGSKADLAQAQSFRLGYMGHVIIICQALVHACTNDGGKSEAPSVVGGGSVSLAGMSSGDPRPEMNGDLGRYINRSDSDDQDSRPQESSAFNDALERGRAEGSVATEETPSNPLILAQLIETHPLRSKWSDFVTTTLATETAIQSTPLGGFAGAPGMDPLHAHRPGLADEGDYSDDDGAAPPLPPRGLLVGGDVIDMDDNDLEIAANMMAGLSMGRSGAGEHASRKDNHADLLAGIPSQDGGRTKSGNYVFDDPLGDGRFGRFDDDDDSSDDDESGTTRDSGDSGGNVVEGVSYSSQAAAEGNSDEGEAPVMDLFAGNLDPFDSQAEGGSGWSNFANFDDAFTTATDSVGPFDGGPEPKQEGAPDAVVDEIFGGVKDHAILLEESDKDFVDANAEKNAEDAFPTEVKTLDGPADEEPVAEDTEGEQVVTEKAEATINP